MAAILDFSKPNHELQVYLHFFKYLDGPLMENEVKLRATLVYTSGPPAAALSRG